MMPIRDKCVTCGHWIPPRGKKRVGKLPRKGLIVQRSLCDRCFDDKVYRDFLAMDQKINR